MLVFVYICKGNVNIKTYMIMKNIITIIILTLSSIGYSQKIQPKFEASGELIKATYFYEDGSIKTHGYFKDKKLTGEWVSYDIYGYKTQLAYYKNGKKVGKWFMWTKEALREINYENNVVVSVNVWKPDSKVALNNE